MKKVYIICPVTNATNEEKNFLEKYVKKLEKKKIKVYYPARDTPQTNDSKVFERNLKAIKEANEIHVYWNSESRGSLVDFGNSIALGKKMFFINLKEFETKENIYSRTLKEIHFNEKDFKEKVSTIKEAQNFVKNFAKRNKWVDKPNIDKFDHLHEELLEMSKYLRYKKEKDRINFVKENKEIFIDGIGDLFFAMCRLSNQLGVDIEESFNFVKESILEKYNHKNSENKLIKK